VYLALLYRGGRAKWKTWEHPVPQPWEWSGFIHPPFFSEHQRALERWAGAIDLLPGELLAFLAAGVGPILVLLAAWLAAPRDEPPAWAGYAAALMAFSPAGLRPFEHYPASRLAVGVALVAALWYARRGGSWRLAVAFVAGLVATQVHLSVWFILGPMLVFLLWPMLEQRRGLGALTIGLLLAFWALASPNPLYENALIDAIDQPAVRAGHVFTHPSFLNPTFELSNKWLFWPLVLWGLPWIWREERRGLPLAVGIAVYVAVHLLLQRRGLALHWHAPEPHHYFELIEIAAVVAWTWLLMAVWGRWPRREARVAVGVAGAVVLISQVLAWIDVNQSLIVG
jgi:hypothetical protein